MSMRSDALKTLKGQEPDHIPFIARMDLWYEHHNSLGTLPAPYQGASLWDIQRDMGIGVLGFGAWMRTFYRLEHVGDVEIRTWWEGNQRFKEYVTPHGILQSRAVLSEKLRAADVTPLHVEYPFKDVDDYDALQYLFEHTRVVENYEEYEHYLAGIGDDGLALPYIEVPMHLLMKEYIGYNQFYFELHDHLPRLEQLAGAVTSVQMEVVKIGAASPTQIIEVGGNYDEVMTPHPIFREHFLPFFKGAGPVLHSAGKSVATHGDGDMGQELLTLMRETGVDVVEALTPQPMTSIDIRQAREIWGGEVALWGGIPAVLMTDTYSDEDMNTFLEALFDAVAPGDRFILGFGDNVPTDGLFSRILQVVDFYHRHSAYPIKPANPQRAT
jgi:hypothetical protein